MSAEEKYPFSFDYSWPLPQCSHDEASWGKCCFPRTAAEVLLNKSSGLQAAPVQQHYENVDVMDILQLWMCVTEWVWNRPRKKKKKKFQHAVSFYLEIEVTKWLAGNFTTPKGSSWCRGSWGRYCRGSEGGSAGGWWEGGYENVPTECWSPLRSTSFSTLCRGWREESLQSDSIKRCQSKQYRVKDLPCAGAVAVKGQTGSKE